MAVVYYLLIGNLFLLVVAALNVRYYGEWSPGISAEPRWIRIAFPLAFITFWPLLLLWSIARVILALLTPRSK